MGFNKSRKKFKMIEIPLLEYQFTTLKQKMLETRNVEDFHMRCEASKHTEAQEVLETQRVI